MVVIKAIFMSMTCAAIHVFAPDHLGTLLMLSALTSPREAFKIGASWGVGHSAGMILICALFLCLKTLADKHLKLWEHIGEYCVGASMMLVALYFFCKESQYLHRNDDGTVEAVPCACHHIHVSARQQRMASPHFKMNSPDCRSRSHNPDTFPPPPEHSLQSTDVHATQIARPCGGTDIETAPLLLTGESPHSEYYRRRILSRWCCQCFVSTRDGRGAFLGLFQGMCCPTGLVGVFFVAKDVSLKESALFLVVFTLFSSLGSAILAASWSMVSSKGLGTCISPTAIYRGSCTFTFVLGILWTLATYCGYHLDYTKKIHKHN